VVLYINKVNRIIEKEADSSSRVGPATVCFPVIALVRAHSSAFCMRFPHLTFHDLFEYLAGLQRSVAELQAYILWYDHIQYSDILSNTRSFELGLRGSIAQSNSEYVMLRKLGIPVWLELQSMENLQLDIAKEVKLRSMHVEM
jgi:hypothetical protein